VLVIGDSLLDTPTISHPAASNLFVVAKPIPSELPTSIALDCLKEFSFISCTSCGG
jgi:hypothetical protein